MDTRVKPAYDHPFVFIRVRTLCFIASACFEGTRLRFGLVLFAAIARMEPNGSGATRQETAQ
jgi:hypothetical protein